MKNYLYHWPLLKLMILLLKKKTLKKRIALILVFPRNLVSVLTPHFAWFYPTLIVFRLVWKDVKHEFQKIKAKFWLLMIYKKTCSLIMKSTKGNQSEKNIWYILPRGDCKRPCFDQLNAHILERHQNSKRSKMCAFSWSKHGRSQSNLGP